MGIARNNEQRFHKIADSITEDLLDLCKDYKKPTEPLVISIDSKIGFSESALQAMRYKDEQFEKVIKYAEDSSEVFISNEREKFIKAIKDIYYGR